MKEGPAHEREQLSDPKPVQPGIDWAVDSVLVAALMSVRALMSST